MSSLLEKIESLKHRYEEIGTQLGDPGVIADRKRYKSLTKSYRDLEKIVIAGDEYRNVLANIDGAKDVIVNEKDEEFRQMLEILGETPLPKYIKRKPDEEDKERYQTVYAKHEGAVAAPTAGLHFSKELIKRLEIQGVRFAEVTLHTGLGTFRPIEVEDLSKHKMDAEYYHIDETACAIVNKAIKGGHRICSVGTTTMRAIETSYTAEKLLKPSEGWTNTFIHPPYNFNIADSLITNLHLPKTSLLIMLCAFAGYDLAMEAYKKAIKDKYRFFSYGDAMLVV